MPPNGTQYANRIGVGVLVDDGGATVTYLNTILARMREIQNLARATSISIRVYNQGGAAGGAGGEGTRIEARTRATARAVETETRQLSLLDRIDEEMSRREQQRARETGNVLIGENRRATGVLAQSFAFEERLRQERLTHIRRMTDEELRLTSVRFGGRDVATEEEIARRRAALPPREAQATAEELARARRSMRPGITEQRPTGFGLEAVDVAREEQARRDAIRSRYQRGRERGAITDELRGEEIEAEAQQRLRRQELNQRINDRANRITAEREAAERVQAVEMARRTRAAEAAATARGYRTPEEQQGLEAQNRRQYESGRAVLRRQVAAARQRREDEARQAQFREEQEQRAREYEAGAPRRAAREAQRRREAEQEADVRTFRTPRTQPTFRGAERDILQAAQAANTLSANLNRIAGNRNVAPNIRQQAQTIRASLQQATQQAVALNQQLHAPQGQRPPYAQVLQNLQQLQNQIHQTRVQAAALNNQVLNQPGGPGGGGPGAGGGAGGGGGRGGGRSLYQRGIFGFGGGGGLGSITASILTRDLIRGAIRDTERFVQVSLQAAAAEQEASNELALTANNSGRLAQENLRLAESVHRQYGITRTLSAEAVTGAQEFALRAGRTALTPQLLQALQDIGAAKGVTAKQLPQFIQQAQNEQGRFTERYLGQRVSSVYEDYARENRDKLSAGLRDTQATLPALVASLTDFEREQALVNAILRESAKYHGAAAQRANTVAGNMDRLGSTVNDIEVSFGRFLETNRTVREALEGLAGFVNRTFGTGANLPITGPGGVVYSGADIEARVAAGMASGSQSFSSYFDGVVSRLGILFSPLLAGYGAYTGFRRGGVRGAFSESAELATYPLSLRATKRAQDEEEYRQQATRERNQQITELARTNRLVYTGGPVNFATGQGFRIKTETEALKEYDEQLARTNQAERERDAEEKRSAEEAQAREREREQYLERVRSALQRLREIEEQGGQTVERVAQVRAGTDNQYVKTLSELESVQARMQTQWGALGQGAVTLFTTLETQSLKAQLAAQRVNSLTEAIRLQTQAARERDQLELGADLTRGEQARADTVRLQVEALRKIPEMEARLGQITGVGRTRTQGQRAQDFIGDLYARFGGPGAGIGPGQRAEKGIINQAVLGMLSEFPTAVIRNTPAFRAAYISAIEGQITEARQGVADAIGRERLISRENERLIATAVRFEDERQRALGGAGSEVERRAIGRAFDRALTQQTEGISPRELAQMGLFNVRNEAIQREAERVTQDEAEARQAVQEGLQVQKGILYATTLIAAALASGDMSLLVQVENNTRATIDAERLKRAGEALVGENQLGPRAVTNVGNVNPYQGLNDRYGRPGRD